MASPPAKVQKRANIACTHCRLRKVKCKSIEGSSRCERCESSHLDCIFVPVSETATTDKRDPSTGAQPSSSSSVPSSSPSSAPSYALGQFSSTYAYQNPNPNPNPTRPTAPEIDPALLDQPPLNPSSSGMGPAHYYGHPTHHPYPQNQPPHTYPLPAHYSPNSPWSPAVPAQLPGQPHLAYPGLQQGVQHHVLPSQNSPQYWPPSQEESSGTMSNNMGSGYNSRYTPDDPADQ